MKTLEEFNREFQLRIDSDKFGTDEESQISRSENKYTPAEIMSQVDTYFADIMINEGSLSGSFRDKRAKSIFKLAIPYITVIVLLIVAAVINQQVLHLSVFCIQGTSMQDVYPDGSLLVVRNVPTDDILVGDDVTYESNGIYITHRVIKIYDNYNGTGHRAFLTQGVNNSAPDPIVTATKISGIVTHSVKNVGQAYIWTVNHKWVFPVCIGVAAAGLLTGIMMDRKRKTEAVFDFRVRVN